MFGFRSWEYTINITTAVIHFYKHDFTTPHDLSKAFTHWNLLWYIKTKKVKCPYIPDSWLACLYGFMFHHFAANLVKTVMKGHEWWIWKNKRGILYKITVVIMSTWPYNWLQTMGTLSIDFSLSLMFDRNYELSAELITIIMIIKFKRLHNMSFKTIYIICRSTLSEGEFTTTEVKTLNA
jgi:hypothetical protein